ncbi:MAG: hypothetical protein EXS30_09590 [Pedosphaera sp.]|nr:hypothetical protein [Pedosphaera sp.]
MQPSPEGKEITSQFEKLLADLARSGVDFAVVGGIAVILNGYPRFTLDVDILVDEKIENIRRVLAYLECWGEGWARELKEEDFVPQEGSIRVMEDFEIDIFTRMRGKSLDDFRPRLRYLETSGVRIPYISPQDLIYLKQGSWRDKDKLDVLAMQEIIAREAKTT